MRILKGDWRRMHAVWMIGVVVLAGVFLLLGILIWPDERTDPAETKELVVLDKTPLNLRLLATDSFVAASLELNPYDASPFRLWHRPHSPLAESYRATFIAPPRLISKFSLRSDSGVAGPTTTPIGDTRC